MSVTIKLHLPVPEGRPGDVVQVSEQRASVLVGSRYATYVSGGDTGPEPEVAEVVAVEADSGPAPVTDLPAATDKKEEWEKAAASLGIDTEGMTKSDIIEAVGEATG